MTLNSTHISTGRRSSSPQNRITRAVEEACKEVTGRSIPITPTARLAEDLDVNSLQRYEILIALEEKWDVELVDDADIVRAQTAGELGDLIAQVLANAAGDGDQQPVVLEGRQLSKLYGVGEVSTAALTGCNVVLGRGELLTVVGPSGSGKSTLLHLLSGLDTPTTGTVWFEKTDLTTLSDAASASLRARRMGFVLQRHNLIPSLTVRENVAAPLMLSGTARRDALDAADRMLDRVGLTRRAAAFPSQISGGEAQRTAVARACVGQPAVIFADEPTGAVDRAAGELVINLFEELVREFDASAVIVTHDGAVAERGDSTLKLIDGRPVP